MFSPNCSRLRSRLSWSKTNKSFVSSSFFSVARFFFSYREVANPALMQFGGWRVSEEHATRFQIGREFESALFFASRPSASSKEEEDKKRAPEQERERNESSARREEDGREEVEERSERIIVVPSAVFCVRFLTFWKREKFQILGGKSCKFRV